ncbi:MAG: hypothetical protein V4714_04040 [Bacteroidota bacterium]
MTIHLTLVIEYVGNNLFNAYLEELPLIRLDDRSFDQGLKAMLSLVSPEMGQIKKIKLVMPSSLMGTSTRAQLNTLKQALSLNCA